jgi:hypothetical protein
VQANSLDSSEEGETDVEVMEPLLVPGTSLDDDDQADLLVIKGRAKPKKPRTTPPGAQRRWGVENRIGLKKDEQVNGDQ